MFITRTFCIYRRTIYLKPYVLVTNSLRTINNQVIERRNSNSKPPRPNFNFKHLNQFHTSDRRSALPPAILILLRLSAQISSVIFGRKIRKWWRGLPEDQKEVFVETQVKPYKSKIIGSLVALVLSIIFYYQYHLKENPVIKRKQFIIFNEEQMNILGEEEVELIKMSASSLPPNHPLHKIIAGVLDTLLKANPELNKKKYTILVVDDINLENAFVTPNGYIIIATGILKYCSNIDQLAIILAHELAHDFLDHIAERISKETFQQWLFIVPLLAFWSIFPDIGAFALSYIASRAHHLALTLPFSRHLEKEADVLGLSMAARACADVREASAFWGKLTLKDLLENKEKIPEWLSTHPKNETRHFEMEQLIENGLEIRRMCQCPLIKQPDPRRQINYFIDQFKQAQKMNEK